MSQDQNQEMTAEDAATKAKEMLENMRATLRKFLSTEHNQGFNKSSIYHTGNTGVPSKRKHFAENLALVEQGCEDLLQAREDLKHKIISSGKTTP